MSGNALSGMAGLMPTGEDLLYEEELLRNPYSLKLWWRYLEARKDVPPKRRYLLYERALKVLPGSYKVSPEFRGKRQFRAEPGGGGRQFAQ